MREHFNSKGQNSSMSVSTSREHGIAVCHKKIFLKGEYGAQKTTQ